MTTKLVIGPTRLIQLSAVITSDFCGGNSFRRTRACSGTERPFRRFGLLFPATHKQSAAVRTGYVDDRDVWPIILHRAWSTGRRTINEARIFIMLGAVSKLSRAGKGFATVWITTDEFYHGRHILFSSKR